MNKIVYRSEDRGKANYGWLDTKYSFSFANYYNPEMMNFGLLRVLNDDTVKPAAGFGTHPHNNMEIITFILEGALEHRDSMGNGSVIYKNEIQVMSAGSGITHSEFNPSKTDDVKLLQIWIFPKESNITPRYDQKNFTKDIVDNKLITAVSGLKKEGSLYIHQNAEIHIGKFNRGENLIYNISSESNGAYLFLIEGELKAANEELFKRDALGISQTKTLSINVVKDSYFIIIDVPMN